MPENVTWSILGSPLPMSNQLSFGAAYGSSGLKILELRVCSRASCDADRQEVFVRWPCYDDDHEQNDSREQAGPPRNLDEEGYVALEAVACPSDDDWYAFEVEHFTDVHAFATFSEDDGAIRLWLFGEVDFIGPSESDGGFAYIDALLEPGTYYVAVTFDGDGPEDEYEGSAYHLEIEMIA